MSVLSEKFEEIAAEIEKRDSPIVHYPLLPILAATNGGVREFNRAALTENNIDPDRFLTIWAIGFAKGTLVMNSTYKYFRSSTLDRCATCLSTETPDSFGHYMPDDLRKRLIVKQAEMTPHQK